MPLQIIVGTQWGDEGKGRIVDWFAAAADLVARYNGGDNAGHSVNVGGRLFKLHLVPSGIIHPHTTAVLGSGMVINPASLFDEIDSLVAAGVSLTPGRLRISYAAHLITPAHQALDKAMEGARGKASIGTTGRGIGPAYTDKAARRGLRIADMLEPGFLERLGEHIDGSNQYLDMYGAAMLNPVPVLEAYQRHAARIAPFVADTSAELGAALAAGRKVLAEAAQGTLLDLDHGTYPFVTSSSTLASGALTGLGLGIGAARDAQVSGVCKAFQTRVGSGPFPTEVHGDLAKRLRGSGANPWDEFGTTTGRPRRVGWLDGVLLRYAVRINGLTELVITKLDVLSGLDEVQLCVAYTSSAGGRAASGETFHELPFGPTTLGRFAPVYESFHGWREDVSHARRWEELPANARAYLEAISELARVPLRLVSVGPERDQIVERG
jgi:adenylosuccinate synthase